MKKTVIAGLITIAMLSLAACSGKEQVDYDVTEATSSDGVDTESATQSSGEDEVAHTTEQNNEVGDTNQASSVVTSDWQVPEKLEVKITGEKRDVNIVVNDIRNKYIECVNDTKINLNVMVRNEEQLKACLDNDVDDIYVCDYSLYLKYKDYKNIVYRVDRLDNKKNLIVKLTENSFK